MNNNTENRFANMSNEEMVDEMMEMHDRTRHGYMWAPNREEVDYYMAVRAEVMRRMGTNS